MSDLDKNSDTVTSKNAHLKCEPQTIYGTGRLGSLTTPMVSGEAPRANL
ncbi:MAG: hypothetical protein J6C44_06190 [Muribaculaceae bacterium]|nr:hypothetical protein [Muribaculaceae bacterium]MBO5187510.1 hypothetical protein [Prevotella sp.]